MAFTNVQLYKFQGLLIKQLKNYEGLAQKFQSCLTLHLDGNNTTSTSDKVISETVELLQHEAENVSRLELRMAIVAPMKAGKSTIINALIGENILPTRGSAMTTLPTEIAFHKDTTCPTLILTKEGIDLIIKLQHRIQLYLKFTKTSVEELFNNQSQLMKIASDIMSSKGGCYFTPSTSTTGLNQMQQTLTFVNDLVRIFLMLSKIDDSDLKDVSLKPLLQKSIRLEVPAGSLRHENITDTEISVGNLTIVDTPGPNEAAASKELQDIVKGELQKAAIIILVLNFTSMGTAADQEIFKEVDAIRQANVDNDCIYVIVNKVDQRRKGDMSPDDVKKFIAQKYQIEEKRNQSASKRIFEMKAVHCLVSRRFFTELEEFRNNNRPLELKSMTTAEELTNELYKVDIDDEEKSLEDLERDARKLWKKSGFEEFTKCAISDLIKNIAQRSTLSAFNICVRSGTKLTEEILRRQIFLDANVTTLEIESDKLERDCQTLTTLKDGNVKKLEVECVNLEKELNQKLKAASQKCQNLTAELFAKDTWRSNFDTGKYYAKGTFGTGLIVGGLLSGLLIASAPVGIPIAVVGGIVGASVIRNTDDNKMFEDKVEAIEFVKELRGGVNRLCSEVWKSLAGEIDSLCEKINNSLLRYLKGETCEIVSRANERLNKNFQIEFARFKKCEIELKEMDMTVDISVQKYRKLWGYSLIGRKCLISADEDDQVSDVKLCMSRKDVKQMCIGFIENTMKLIQDEINQKYKEELRNTFYSHFNELHTLFQEYKDEMTQTLLTKKQSQEKQQQFRTNLEMIRKDVEKEAINVKKLATELGIQIKDV